MEKDNAQLNAIVYGDKDIQDALAKFSEGCRFTLQEGCQAGLVLSKEVRRLQSRLAKYEKALREHQCPPQSIEPICFTRIMEGKKCTASEALEDK